MSTVRQAQDELKALIEMEQRNKFKLKDEGSEVSCMWRCFIMCVVLPSQEPLRRELAATFVDSLTREVTDSEHQVW